jgi:hypothetical protein
VLGTRQRAFLDFRIVSCVLPGLPARAHFDSSSVVARLNLPNMAHRKEERVDVYAQAMRALPTATTVEHFEALLPWNLNAEQLTTT